ncbi:uncharacterized protein LOC133785644 [Humulus lupulus]|uniref:uncharacterized protein LOC133785644 n=1 Tax=Humulus lupulus TaxID=3486 RepID=UPI002B411B6E|nr:uncharacterized protein LOC133785644 [Humulus lupulus]
MLEALKFPKNFTNLIMECVTTTLFSFSINGAHHGFLQAKRGLRQGDPISPLLFVIGMEYLTRILSKVAKAAEFKFHPRCQSLKLTHLCFADDLLLFCKGDYISAHLLLKGFKLFSNSSGLKANISKFAVYGAGMNSNTIDRLVALSGFQKCSLPFQYLGMKICAKRISKADCVSLVDKMVSRIRIWSSRNLSYAGRIVLINSVLLSINSYWSQLVILPRSIFQRIIQVCRAYLWKGVDWSCNPGHVSWSVICRSKSEGGLGFRDIALWNFCAMGKHVWDISSKKDNLWVKWVNTIYIKQGDWWNHVAPIDASWYWKRIVQVKDKLKSVFSHQEFHRFNFTIASLVSKLNIVAGRWQFAMIWDRFSYPKHRVIIWLALLDRLPTLDRIQRYKPLQSLVCLLCGNAVECHSHLFFSCCVSSKILVEIMQWCNIAYQGNNLKYLLKWIGKKKISQGRRKIFISIISALVYHIWHSRNYVLWNQISIPIVVIVRNIIHSVCERLFNINFSKFNRVDQNWVESLLRVCN